MAGANRLVSIDFLRGLTVACMILVNNPGSWDYIYPLFSHAHWNGCTPTDLIFPFFLFIVGVSIHFSLSKMKANGNVHNPLVYKILKRSAILFALGLALNLIPDFDLNTLRIMGVLQRIALVFGVCALLYLYIPISFILLIAPGLVVLYFLALMLPSYLGIGNFDLGPETNLGAWLDRKILVGHMWSQSVTWDPEGLFSTIPAISSGLIGVIYGQWLDSTRDSNVKIKLAFVVGGTLVLLGLAWDIVFPINKSLWTSSFVLFTSGIAMCMSTFFYWIIDIKHWEIGKTPFLAFGSNAIVAYMLSEMLAKLAYLFTFDGLSFQEFVYQTCFQRWLGSYNGSLAMALMYVALCFVPIWILYRKKIYIKV